MIVLKALLKQPVDSPLFGRCASRGYLPEYKATRAQAAILCLFAKMPI